MSNQSTGHPGGLGVLFLTEMAERFSYYGMRAIFVLFMTNILLINNKEASNIYGSYTGLVYLTPLLGGYLSDKFLGNKRSILIGGVLMALGQLLMFFSAGAANPTAGSDNGTAVSLMWGGLTLLIVGNGFFKPNISTMVGQLYPANDSRIDSAFTIFYMGINMGAAAAPILCGWLAESYDYKWGFLAACIGMVLSLIMFVFAKDKYLINTEGKKIGEQVKTLDFMHIGIVIATIAFIFFLMNFKTWFNSDVDLVAYLIYGAMIAMPIIILTDKSLTKEERDRIIVIFILAFFVIFFWSAFEQAGASLTIFADKQTNRNIGSWTMPTSWFQSVNPVAVILLAPAMAALWGWLNKRNMEPSSPIKMGYGLALLTIGYLVIWLGLNFTQDSGKISMWWLFGLYILHTVGELCLSPIGLSMVSKLSPLRLSSLLMGTWFLANAAANKFAGTLSSFIPSTDGTPQATNPSFLGFEIANLHDFFMLFIVMTAVAAGILFVMSGFLRKMMHGVK